MMVKKAYYFDKVFASYVAMRLKPINRKKISGVELEILEKINDSKKLIAEKQLARLEGIPQESVSYVVHSLEEKGLVERGSGWRTTEKGKRVIEEALSLYEESKGVVKADKSFSNFITVSGTRIEH